MRKANLDNAFLMPGTRVLFPNATRFVAVVNHSVNARPDGGISHTISYTNLMGKGKRTRTVKGGTVVTLYPDSLY